MSDAPVRLEASWKVRLEDYLRRPDMQALAAFLRAQKADGKHIYPPGPAIFTVFCFVSAAGMSSVTTSPM